MMIRLVSIVSCWLIGWGAAYSAETDADHVSPLIYGEWKLVGASVSVPVKCRRTTLWISPDGYVSEQSRSIQGELFSFRAQASIKQQGSRFVLILRSPEHNGKPDCLGNPARYISHNFMNAVHLQLNGNRLYHYLGDDQQTGYLRYERVSTAGRQ